LKLKSSHPVSPYLVFLAAFIVRIYRLGASSLWYDETVSLFVARQDLVSLTRHTAGDIHPPLYYYLLHFWGLAAGWSEFSAAFLSLFFGALLVALVYRVAREWFGNRVALLAAFLVAISPYNLWYSQEVRMYTLGAVLGLVSVYFFLRLIERRSPRDFVAYVLVGAAGMYTLYYFAFLLAFENLVGLVTLIRKLPAGNNKFRLSATLDLSRPWFLSQIAIILLYIPWLPVALRQIIDPPVPPWRSFTSLQNVLIESFTALSLGQSVEPSAVWYVLLLVAAALTVVFLPSTRASNKGKTDYVNPYLLLGYTFVPLAIIYLVSIWKPLYHVRYIFTYSPAFYILLALGVMRVFTIRPKVYALQFGGKILSAAILLTLSGACIYSAYNFWFNPKYADDDLRGAVKRISESWRPGDAILINAGYTYTAFLYYFDQPIEWRGRLTSYLPTSVSTGTIQRLVDQRAGAIVLQTGSINGSASLGWGSPESDFYATTAEETRAALDRVFATSSRIWMLRLYDTVVDPSGIVRDYLAEHGKLIDDQVYSGESNTRTQGYLTTRAPLTLLPPSATRREIMLGSRIAFMGFEPAELSVHPGQAIDINLYWRAQEATNADLLVFVGLFTEDGTLVASSSEQPLGNALGTTRWRSDEVMREPIRLIVPTKVPLGHYVMRIVMYDPFTNEPLGADKNDLVKDGSQILISSVRIE
jgi:4-amino-4-deoxy-L-arabinose transferase-like glycosyltransferase